MEQLIQRCAGIDVGQAESVVCVRVPDAVTGAPAELIASYGTTTPDLLELVDWLRGLGVTDVAMESTGVYWKPIYYPLEDDFTVLLVNAAHIKHVPDSSRISAPALMTTSASNTYARQPSPTSASYGPVVLSSTGSIDDGNNTFDDSARMVLTSVAHVPEWAG
jgi:hypothetical protein